MENSDEQRFLSKTYKDARVAYVWYATLAYLIELLTEDAFLSKLLLCLGVSESRVGVISSLISLAFLTQVFSLPLLRRKLSYKRVSLVFTAIGLCSFVPVFLLPIVSAARIAVQTAAIVLVLLAHASRKFVSGVHQRWTNDFVDPHKRGSFSALKESVSLVVGIVFSLAIGFVFDAFEAKGQTDTAFTVFALAIFASALGAFLCLMKIPEGDFTGASGHPAGEVFKNTLGDAAFRRVLLLTVLWEMGRYFTLGFTGTFKTETLGMTMLTVQIINTVSCVFRLIFTPLLGRYADKHSFSQGIGLGLIIALTSFACLIFTTPETWLLAAVHTVLYQVCLAGVNQNFMNIAYSYVHKNYLTEALAIRASLGGLAGFLASAAAGKIFDLVAADEGFLGSLAPQQVLAAVSCLLLLGALAYEYFAVRPMPVKKQ